VLCEVTEKKDFGIELEEDHIPVNPAVADACEMLGMDPLYIANEGKAVFVVPQGCAESVLEIMNRHPLGKKAAIIGKVTNEHPGKVVMNTSLGGKRWVDYLSGDQLPRIC